MLTLRVPEKGEQIRVVRDGVWSEWSSKITDVKVYSTCCLVVSGQRETYVYYHETYEIRTYSKYGEPYTPKQAAEDKAKFWLDYWGCRGFKCMECPCRIGYETPSQYYGNIPCADAKHYDIARREIEAGIFPYSAQ